MEVSKHTNLLLEAIASIGLTDKPNLTTDLDAPGMRESWNSLGSAGIPNRSCNIFHCKTKKSRKNDAGLPYNCI